MLQGFGGTELTFEAWVQTSDYCHHGVLMHTKLFVVLCSMHVNSSNLIPSHVWDFM